MRTCNRLRKTIVAIVISSTCLAPQAATLLYADTVSTPNFNLDGSNPSSLASSTPTTWRDLVTGSIALTVDTNAIRSSEGGGSITTSASLGSSGAYLPPTTINSASNPAGDMTLMTWVKATSWNGTWNLIASRWFINFAGAGAVTDQDYHFSIKTNSSNARVLNIWTTNKQDQFGSYEFSLNKWYLVGFTISSSGNLQFYVNGKSDGASISGAGHTARSTTYLSVGDLRTAAACNSCSINGNIARFRIWNSVLTASQIAADYKNEAAAFGYSTSLALSTSAPNPVYRVNKLITATISGPTVLAGIITFFENGKVIPGCGGKSVISSTPTCTWKPSRHGVTKVSATYWPTDIEYVSGTGTSTWMVEKRQNLR